MAKIAFPLDNTPYKANAEQAFLSGRTSGVYCAETELSVSANNNMTVTVSEGRAWLNPTKFQGMIFCNYDDVLLEVGLPDGFNQRIDRVVLRYDVPLNDVFIQVKQGIPSKEPKPPTLERNPFIAYEIGLAEIHLDRGSTFISSDMIIDTRLDETVCGVVRDGITGIPTQKLVDQFLAWYNTHTIEWKNNWNTWYSTNTEAWATEFVQWYSTNTEKWTSDFQQWFNSIKGQLSGDVAANLQNQINEINPKLLKLEQANTENAGAISTNTNNINLLQNKVTGVEEKVNSIEGNIVGKVADKATLDIVNSNTTGLKTSISSLDRKVSNTQSATMRVEGKVEDVQLKSNAMKNAIDDINSKIVQMPTEVNARNSHTVQFNRFDQTNLLAINGSGVLGACSLRFYGVKSIYINIDDIVLEVYGSNSQFNSLKIECIQPWTTPFDIFETGKKTIQSSGNLILRFYNGVPFSKKCIITATVDAAIDGYIHYSLS